MGSDFSNYQVYLGAEFQTSRSILIDSIDSAMRVEGLSQVHVSHTTVEAVLEKDRVSRCFGVSPAHTWVTVLDSLPSVYGEPLFLDTRVCSDRHSIKPTPEPDVDGEKLRQEKCMNFLTTLSNSFPSVWVKVFDSCELEAYLFLNGKQVGTFVYPTDYRAVNPVELKFDTSIQWPEMARLPSDEVEFWESSENVARGRQFSALAAQVGWLPESVNLGFTVDSEGTLFWYAVPEEYELLCYTEVGF
jgi:hypothetical protein